LVVAVRRNADVHDNFNTVTSCQTCLDRANVDPTHYFEFRRCNLEYGSQLTIPATNNNLLFGTNHFGFAAIAHDYVVMGAVSFVLLSVITIVYVVVANWPCDGDCNCCGCCGPTLPSSNEFWTSQAVYTLLQFGGCWVAYVVAAASFTVGLLYRDGSCFLLSYSMKPTYGFGVTLLVVISILIFLELWNVLIGFEAFESCSNSCPLPYKYRLYFFYVGVLTTLLVTLFGLSLIGSAVGTTRDYGLLVIAIIAVIHIGETIAICVSFPSKEQQADAVYTAVRRD